MGILVKPSRQERSRNTWKEIGKETPSEGESPRFTSSCSRNGAASEVKREQVRSSEIERETKRDCLNLHQHGVLVLRRMKARMRDEEGTGSPVHLFCMPFSPAIHISKLTIQNPDELDFA